MTDTPDLRDDLPDDPDAALAGEYVLRLLGPEETAACAAREARDPAFAALVAAWRRDLEPLDAAYAEAAPPAGLERRITERLFGAPPSPFARLWESVGLWRAVAAAAVVAAVWLAVPAVRGPGEAPARLVSALAAQGGSDVTLVAVLEPAAAVLSINRTSGAAPQGRALELWAIEGTNPPVSLGVLPDAPLARVALPPDLVARLGPGAVLAVTEEAPGGSPTGAPTGAPVAAGTLSDV